MNYDIKKDLRNLSESKKFYHETFASSSFEEIKSYKAGGIPETVKTKFEIEENNKRSYDNLLTNQKIFSNGMHETSKNIQY